MVNLKEIEDVEKDLIDGEKPMKKIMVLGLANSGKTSIVLSLKGTHNILSYYSLKPTKNIDIQKIVEDEKRFFIWDFGGQKKFRDKYLEEFPKNAERASQLIFVIDVQDYNKYENAMEYLNQILNFPDVKNMEILIYLHKYDPYIEEDQNHIVHEKLSELIPQIRSILKNKFEYKIFKTSIYTTFRKLSA